MEKVQELIQDIVHTDTSPEPVSQHAFPECLTHSDLLPNQRQSLCTVLPENSGVFGYSIADLTITPLVKHSIDTGNAKPIKQRAYRASHHHLKNIEKQVQEMLQSDIFKPSVSPWASLVTLLSKLPYTITLKSHYHLFGATGDALTTLGTVQVDLTSDSKIWSTPAIVVSSLDYPLIQGLNFLKLTKSKINLNTNTVEIGSKIHPADVHCITNSNSTIIILTSDIYQPYQLLLDKKACWMTIFILITAVVVMAAASHTHYHFEPPFKEPDKPIVSPARTLTWKKLSAYGTLVRLKIRLQDPSRLVNYNSLTGRSHQSWRKDYTFPITLFWVSTIQYLLKIPP